MKRLQQQWDNDLYCDCDCYKQIKLLLQILLLVLLQTLPRILLHTLLRMVLQILLLVLLHMLQLLLIRMILVPLLLVVQMLLLLLLVVLLLLLLIGRGHVDEPSTELAGEKVDAAAQFPDSSASSGSAVHRQSCGAAVNDGGGVCTTVSAVHLTCGRPHLRSRYPLEQREEAAALAAATAEMKTKCLSICLIQLRSSWSIIRYTGQSLK